MGFFDFLFGNEEKKIEKMRKNKAYNKLIAYAKGDAERENKRKAIQTLIDMVKSHELDDREEEEAVEFLEPLTGIKAELRIDRLDDPYEIRKIAVNELIKKREFDQAIYALKRAIELKPNEVSFKNNLAAAYSYNDDFESARQVWEEILSEKPDDATALENYTTSMTIRARRIIDKEPQSEEAEELLKKALEYNPHHINVLNTLAEYYFHMSGGEEMKKSIDYYRSCLKNARVPAGYSSVNEYRAMVHKKMGTVYKILYEKEDAIHHFRQALQLHRWDEDAKMEIQKDIDTLEGKFIPDLEENEEEELKSNLPDMGLYR